MMEPPSYFDAVQKKAASRWLQLEADEGLKGPWEQLFRQLQNPRHVLSELLQNADDAGASEANVSIEDGHFTFTHNGLDFSLENFTALCSFAQSNKKTLQTIGFRGIGFKSTFSLGDVVELYTPSLSLRFMRNRFTEPVWIANQELAPSRTTIRVAIKDKGVKAAISKNLQEWSQGPLPLLFFESLRTLRIAEHEIAWKDHATGPQPEATWYALNDRSLQPLLLVRSNLEQFPQSAILEILEERNLFIDDHDPPSCKVQLVLHSSQASGRLHVVLDAGVATALPFAINAPFLQDPGRQAIKDPAISPTNRWLLERAGALAAETMLAWLKREDLSLEERTKAYALLPEVNSRSRGLEGSCEEFVLQGFKRTIRGKQLLLTSSGDLSLANRSLAYPNELLQIWPEDLIRGAFDHEHRQVLASQITAKLRRRLCDWDFTKEIRKEEVLRVLESVQLPKPEGWQKLTDLWDYCYSDSLQMFGILRNLQIFPGAGRQTLLSKADVIRIDDKTNRLLARDIDLLGEVAVLDQEWLTYLDQHASSELRGDLDRIRAQRVKAILERLEFGSTATPEKLIALMLQSLSARESKPVRDYVRLAHNAARLDAHVSERFPYVTRDCCCRTCTGDSRLLFDSDGYMETSLPNSWLEPHLLHASYSADFQTCSAQRWLEWARSSKSGLGRFPSLIQSKELISVQEARSRLLSRGSSAELDIKHCAGSWFDFDYDPILWQHWEKLAEGTPGFWVELFDHLVEQPMQAWGKCTRASFKSGPYSFLDREDPVPSNWIMAFRNHPCLRDSKGFPQRPSDLLLRCQATEAYRGTERFIEQKTDRLELHALLKLLGVSDKGPGPKREIERLRALMASQTPPLREVDRIYRSLDEMWDVCATEDQTLIKNELQQGRTIFTESGVWCDLLEVFQVADEENLPEAQVVRVSVRDLALWRRVGVREKPTVEYAIEWLGSISSGSRLRTKDLRRVSLLLRRLGARVWNECGHWLNLSVEWSPINNLRYSMTQQTEIPFDHLYEPVRRLTADLRMLPSTACAIQPFNTIVPLANVIEERFDESETPIRSRQRKDWLNQIAIETQGVEFGSDEENDRLHNLAVELENTFEQIVPGMKTTPCIAGAPAGLAHEATARWQGSVLYVRELRPPQLVRSISHALGQRFMRQEIEDAIRSCAYRDTPFIVDYFEANFEKRSQSLDLNGKASVVVSGDQATGNSGQLNDACGEMLTEEAFPMGSLFSALSSIESEANRTARQKSVPIDHAKPLQPASTTIRAVERFAEEQSFQRETADRFRHPNGAHLDRQKDKRLWEWRSRDGELQRIYIVYDHCLEHEPLIIASEHWAFLVEHPELYSLLVLAPNDRPKRLKGDDLKHRVTLYPATYRLVWKELYED